MNRKIGVVFLAFVLASALWGGMPAQRASAAITSVQIVYYPNTIAADAGNPNCTTGGGTPFAAYVTVNGNSGDKATVQLLQTGAGICVWNPTSATWISYAAPSTTYPRVTIGTGGSASLWIVGRAITSSGGSNLFVRAYPCNSAFSDCSSVPAPTQGPPVDSPTVSTTMRNMTSSGGWLEESGGDRLGNTILVVKNQGGTIIGLYRTENNSVIEGYTYGSGGYKVAVPHCATCNYTIETWNASNPGVPLGNVNVLGTTCSVNDIAAGTLVNLDSPVCNDPTAITLVSFSATSPTGKAALLALLLFASALVAVLIRRRAVLRASNR